MLIFDICFCRNLFIDWTIDVNCNDRKTSVVVFETYFITTSLLYSMQLYAD